MDDGKRLDALDVVLDAKALYLKGGSLREGGLQIASGRRVVDLCWHFFGSFFCFFFNIVLIGFFFDF